MLLQSCVPVLGQPSLIIHLVTITLYTHLEPLIDADDSEQTSIKIYKFPGFPSPLHCNDSMRLPIGHFRVDEGKFGVLDVTHPWRVAVIWAFRTVPADPDLKFRHLVFLLRKVGDYYERVSIGAVTNAELLERDAAWDYIKIR